MAQRTGFVVLVATLGLCILGAAGSAGAAVDPPTHLRPVQGKADCATAFGATALGFAAAVCDAAVKAGDLQLIWDESDKTVTGYKVYRVDAGGHMLFGAATGTARYFLVKKPREGYANLCFAVQATAGGQTSADSGRYCYAPGATATTRSLEPKHMATQVTWNAPWNIACQETSRQPGPLPLPKQYDVPVVTSDYFRSADKSFGPAVTAFFPWLTQEKPASGRRVANGVYAGNEAVVSPHFQQMMSSKGYGPCTDPRNVFATMPVTATVNAAAGVAFDLGDLAKHKLYSAGLTLKSSQTLGFASGKATLANGGWCPIYVGAASREWWISPPGNLTYSKSGLLTLTSQPASAIDVTSMVSSWASFKYHNAYGFIVASTFPPPDALAVRASKICLTKFASPSLQLVYF